MSAMPLRVFKNPISFAEVILGFFNVFDDTVSSSLNVQRYRHHLHIFHATKEKTS